MPLRVGVDVGAGVGVGVGAGAGVGVHAGVCVRARYPTMCLGCMLKAWLPLS